MKKAVSLFLSLALVSAFIFQTFAMGIETEKVYIFETGKGENIKYYLDDEGMPYQRIEGEKVYIALALDSLVVKDEVIINELNKLTITNERSLPESERPAGYFDLSQCSNTSDSRKYSAHLVSLDQKFSYSPPFYYNAYHKAMVVKTTNHDKPFGGDKHLNITYFYYDANTKRYYSITMMDKDCSVIGGFRFQHSPSLYPVGKLQYIAHSTLRSCDISIYTTPMASGKPII